MPDRVLPEVPPTEDYTCVGWVCTYHDPNYTMGPTRLGCHNTLDCDLVPVWALKREAAMAAFREQRESA